MMILPARSIRKPGYVRLASDKPWSALISWYGPHFCIPQRPSPGMTAKTVGPDGAGILGEKRLLCLFGLVRGAVLLQLAIEGCLADAQQLGGGGHVPLRVLDGV